MFNVFTNTHIYIMINVRITITDVDNEHRDTRYCSVMHTYTHRIATIVYYSSVIYYTIVFVYDYMIL